MLGTEPGDIRKADAYHQNKDKTMTVIRKTAVAVLAAAALTGLGAGVASAAPAAHLDSAQQDIRFFNASPYQMFVAKVDGGAAPAIRDIQPGQSLTVPGYELAQDGMSPQLEVAEYDPTQNIYDISAIMATGYQPGVTPCTPIPGRSNAKEMGCLVQTPNVLAGESGPMQISIWTTNPKHNGVTTNFDANTGDKVAMGNMLAGLATLSPSFVTFDPNVDTVNWGYGPQAQAGTAVWNCNTAEANEQIGGGATHEEATNVTGTFTFTQGIKLFDTVDTSISASISVGHTWTNSTTDTYSIGENIPAHNVGWLGSIPSTESVTGTVTAMSTPGYPISFSNITFTEPGLNKANNPALDYQYVPHARAMTQDEINTYCVSNSASSTAHNNVVTGGTVPDVTVGAIK